MKKQQKINITLQNRLILLGLSFSTILIILIAIFSVVNIQQNLNNSYKNFGQIISKVLAVETPDITQDSYTAKNLSPLEKRLESVMNSYSDIVFVEFRNQKGNLVYKITNSKHKDELKSNFSVSSPVISKMNDNIGYVTVGLTGEMIGKVSTTAKSSILFVFIVVWLVFAFVILVNTYLITRELRLLQLGVKKISSGEFGYKIDTNEVSDEIQDLFNSFNDMSTRLNIYEEQNIEQLTLERNKLEAVLMSIANGVVVCDNNDVVVLVNNHAKYLLELEDDQLLNTEIGKYVDTEGEFCFKDKIEEYKQLSMEEKTSKPIIFNITVDGRIIKSIISPMFTKSNDYVGYIIVMIDVTKEIETDQMKSQFISNVSHELRTPVTVLRSYIDTLYNYGDEFDEDTKKEFIATLNTEVIRLNNMVNDILDFSRLDSNAKIEKSENDISQLVDYCVDRVQILLKEKNLNIDVEKEQDIPLILCNYDSIARALTNYLSNAIKYSPENSTIKVRLYKETENNQVVVTVKDEGIGIPPEFHKKVFERFYRVENKTHSVKGTGLGLHLVKTTIEKHHQGHVFVSSVPDCGATFGFTLPM